MNEKRRTHPELDFYDSANLQSWLERSPDRVLSPVSTSLMQCVVEIRIIAEHIESNPDIDNVTTFDWDNDFKMGDMVASILEQTLIIEKISRMLSSYSFEYEKGNTERSKSNSDTDG